MLPEYHPAIPRLFSGALQPDDLAWWADLRLSPTGQQLLVLGDQIQAGLAPNPFQTMPGIVQLKPRETLQGVLENIRSGGPGRTVDGERVYGAWRLWAQMQLRAEFLLSLDSLVVAHFPCYGLLRQLTTLEAWVPSFTVQHELRLGITDPDAVLANGWRGLYHAMVSEYNPPFQREYELIWELWFGGKKKKQWEALRLGWLQEYKRRAQWVEFCMEQEQHAR